MITRAGIDNRRDHEEKSDPGGLAPWGRRALEIVGEVVDRML
jgi:hypothetical protein